MFDGELFRTGGYNLPPPQHERCPPVACPQPCFVGLCTPTFPVSSDLGNGLRSHQPRMSISAAQLEMATVGLARTGHQIPRQLCGSDICGEAFRSYVNATASQPCSYHDVQVNEETTRLPHCRQDRKEHDGFLGDGIRDGLERAERHLRGPLLGLPATKPHAARGVVGAAVSPETAVAVAVDQLE